MKRHTTLAAFALLALAFSSASAFAQSTRWVAADIPMRSINSSTTSGATPRDSVFWYKNSAATFGGGPSEAAGAYSDTSVWFNPMSWEPSLDLNAYRSNIAASGGSDTTLYFHLIFEQDPVSSVTASMDSVRITVQASWNGSSVASSVATFDVLDATATEQFHRAFFTQLNPNNPSGASLSTLGAFPFIRFILQGDYGGKIRLRARYLTRDS